MKMNEMSRMAEVVNNNGSSGNGEFNFGGRSTPGFGFGSNGNGGDSGDRPPSRLWTAVTNAGLVNPDGSFVNPGSGSSNNSNNTSVGLSGSSRTMESLTTPMGPVKINSRQEALAKIEELQRMRPASTGFLNNAAAKLVGAFETFGSMGMGPLSGNSARNSSSDGTGAIKSEDNNGNDMPPPSRPRSRLGMNVSQMLSDPWNMTIPTVPSLTPSYAADTTASTSGDEQGSSSSSSPSLFPDFNLDSTTNHQGLQVYTVGHLMPRSAIDDMSGTWSFDANMMGGSFNGSGSDSSLNVGSQETRADGSTSGMYDPSPNTSNSSSSGSGPSVGSGASSSSLSSASVVVPSSGSGPSSSDVGSQKLRVRRSTFVPGWAVSPKVLLVEDDAVSRKLSSKFLQVFGCQIDVAVDGVGAVNKMNLEKYDLVLMVSPHSAYRDQLTDRLHCGCRTLSCPSSTVCRRRR